MPSNSPDAPSDDSTRAPLRNIIVELVSPTSTAILAQTHTDSAGVFSLTVPAAGRYYIRFYPPDAKPQLSVELAIAADESETREYLVHLEPRSSSNVYFEFQVEKVATQRRGARAPDYPANLRDRNISGIVLMQYVVDTLGCVEPGSMRVLQSSHPDFEQAVREALPRMRFNPAEISGRKVRQVVQQPFIFNIEP
jgi:TonB family protein